MSVCQFQGAKMILYINLLLCKLRLYLEKHLAMGKRTKAGRSGLVMIYP